MIWILITLIATVSWGFTDLFSKMSVDYNDKDFYIKLTIWTGLATGVLLRLHWIFLICIGIKYKGGMKWTARTDLKRHLNMQQQSIKDSTAKAVRPI